MKSNELASLSLLQPIKDNKCKLKIKRVFGQTSSNVAFKLYNAHMLVSFFLPTLFLHACSKIQLFLKIIKIKFKNRITENTNLKFLISKLNPPSYTSSLNGEFGLFNLIFIYMCCLINFNLTRIICLRGKKGLKLCI